MVAGVVKLMEILRFSAEDDGVRVEISLEVLEEIWRRRGGREGNRGKNLRPEEEPVSVEEEGFEDEEKYVDKEEGEESRCDDDDWEEDDG